MTEQEKATASEFAAKMAESIYHDLDLSAPVELIVRTGGGSFCQRFNFEFLPTSYTVVLDLNQARDFRDIVFIVAHELRHMWQYTNIPALLQDKAERKAAEGRPVKYRALPAERDADEYALDFEARFSYTNKRVNPEAKSMFINVKIARHVLGF